MASLTVQWTGSDGAELRTRYAVDSGQPVVRDLAVRRSGGTWATLGQDLKPEYRVVSGIRRFSSQQGGPLQGLGQLTPERAEKEKWYAYRDCAALHRAARACSRRPGRASRRRAGPGDAVAPPAAGRGGTPAGPAFDYTSPKPEDIRRASSSFKTTSCSVKTDGARLEVTFNGLSMGIFHWESPVHSVSRNQSAFAWTRWRQTNEPSVAYKFDAGLTGFSTAQLSRLAWNDVGGFPQQYQFGGLKNESPVPVRADNRVIVAEGPRWVSGGIPDAAPVSSGPGRSK